MTVAFFLADPFPVVSETFVLNQITGLLERGHDVCVFARRPDLALAHEDVARFRLMERTRYWPELPRNKVVRALRGAAILAKHPGALPALLGTLDAVRFGRDAASLQLLYWASRFAPRAAFDVVCCHFGWNGRHALALRDAGILGGRIATIFHGADVSLALDGKPDRYAALFERGDLFLPVSEHWRRKLVALGCPESRTHVHRMGIDCGAYAFEERRPPAGAPVRLLSVSRLVEKKGTEFGVRALARLVARGRDVRYEIIGDGPLRGSIERLAAELGVGDRLDLRGWQAQGAVRAAMSRAHLLVAPSVTAANGDQEGIPVALMEAMASGMPVVSTVHSGIPELVEDGVSGYLVAERDPDALAAAIEGLIDHPGQWAAMGRAGRARVEQTFDVRTLNDRLVERFERLARDA